MNSFVKLKDSSWGIRVDGPKPVVGDRVAVVKRDGTSNLQTITAVLWHGIARDGQEASLCEIAPAARSGVNRRSGCDCSDGCCDRGCRCGRECNCRGGNIYNC